MRYILAMLMLAGMVLTGSVHAGQLGGGTLWTDTGYLPVNRACAVYDNKLIGFDKISGATPFAGLQIYDGKTLKRGAWMPSTETNEGDGYAAEGVGILIPRAAKMYFCADADYDNPDKSFTECTFTGGTFTAGVIDHSFVDCGIVAGVGRLLLWFEYSEPAGGNDIWYSTDESDCVAGTYHAAANIGVQWQRVNFTDAPHEDNLRHYHGGLWLPAISKLVVLTGDDNNQSAFLVCDNVKDLIDNPDTWYDRWGFGEGDRDAWAETPTVGGAPNRAYVIGWGAQKWRLVGGAFDALKKKLYWIPDSPNTGKHDINCVDMSATTHVVTTVKEDVDGHGWTGLQTSEGALIIGTGSALLPNGILGNGATEYINLYAITPDGDDAALIKRYKIAESNLARGWYPSISAGTAGEYVPYFLKEFQGKVILGGWGRVALHDELRGLGTVRNAWGCPCGTLKTFRNLLTYHDLNIKTTPTPRTILSIEDYGATVAGTTLVTVATTYGFSDQLWVTISDCGTLNGRYQLTSLGGTQTQFYVNKAWDAGMVKGANAEASTDPYPKLYGTAVDYSRYRGIANIDYAITTANKGSRFFTDKGTLTCTATGANVKNTSSSLFNNIILDDVIPYLRGKPVTAIVWVKMSAYTGTTQPTPSLQAQLARSVDYQWSAAATYTTGDRVGIGNTITTRRIWEALDSINAGETPTTNPAKWADRGLAVYYVANTLSRHTPTTNNVAVDMWLPLSITFDVPLDAALYSTSASYSTIINLFYGSSTSVLTFEHQFCNFGLYEGVLTEDLIKATNPTSSSDGIYGGSSVYGRN